MAERTSYSLGTFSWADLSTPDPDGAKAFYSELFGWEADDQPVGEVPGPMTGLNQLSFDPSVANPARVYGYWLGGKDHYEADRRARLGSAADQPHRIKYRHLTR